MKSLLVKRRRGQSIVEMVLLLPLLLMMLLGLADFALAFTAHTKLRNAVAEGGYWAAQNPGDLTGVRTQITTALQELNPPVENQDIVISPCLLVDGEYQTEISVSYDYPVLFGIFTGGPHVQLRNATTVPQFGGCQ